MGPKIKKFQSNFWILKKLNMKDKCTSVNLELETKKIPILMPMEPKNRVEKFGKVKGKNCGEFLGKGNSIELSVSKQEASPLMDYSDFSCIVYSSENGYLVTQDDRGISIFFENGRAPYHDKFQNCKAKISRQKRRYL
jgi:hypothetical protein